MPPSRLADPPSSSSSSTLRLLFASRATAAAGYQSGISARVFLYDGDEGRAWRRRLSVTAPAGRVCARERGVCAILSWSWHVQSGPGVYIDGERRFKCHREISTSRGRVHRCMINAAVQRARARVRSGSLAEISRAGIDSNEISRERTIRRRSLPP